MPTADNNGTNATLENEASTEAASLKVVVSISEGITTIGVQGHERDAYIESFGRLPIEDVLAEIPGIVERAREQWEEQPMNPAHDRSKPAQALSARKPVKAISKGQAQLF